MTLPSVITYQCPADPNVGITSKVSAYTNAPIGWPFDEHVNPAQQAVILMPPEPLPHTGSDWPVLYICRATTRFLPFRLSENLGLPVPYPIGLDDTVVTTSWCEPESAK
jgi:hypothetical protein